MKSVIVLITFLLLAIWGCSEIDSSTEPGKLTNSSVTQSVTAEPIWLGLPPSADKSLSKSFSASKIIKRNKDGEIKIDESYKASNGNEVKVIVKLKFYAGSLEKDTRVTMKMDSETGVISFSPHQEFLIPAELYIKLEGVTYQGINNSNDADFKYLAASGEYEWVEYKEIIVDRSSKIIELKECLLDHHSRYGFCR